MFVDQIRWTPKAGWQAPARRETGSVQLVLAFGSTELLEGPDWIGEVRARYPDADVVGCSTAGEICGTAVSDDTIVVTAVGFEHSVVRCVAVPLPTARESRSAGTRAAEALDVRGLRHVVALTEGLGVNGTELAAGMRDALPPGVVVTGGLAGDGARMARTCVGLNSAPTPGQLVAIGFYGDRLHVGHGSLGGWDPFGPERIVTRSEGSTLYELDGQSALALYKRYLGEHASGLPASGLLFPLAVRSRDDDRSLVRTILGIDEARGSITFAGDIPMGGIARLMRANFDRLIEGATGAAQGASLPDGGEPDLALLISCVGRKLILGQRIEEEVESVRDVLGVRPVLAGFYSYGELSPHVASARCELHNQTMTITTFAEV